MKLDLVTRKLYTQSGDLIKELYCPLKVRFSQLIMNSGGNFNCNRCSKSVLETANLKEDELLKILKNNPDQCLKIDLNQSNLDII
jgi:hypothetical protein